MKEYLLNELLVRIDDHQCNNPCQSPSTVLLNPVALEFIDRRTVDKDGLLVQTSNKFGFKAVVIN